MYRILTRLPVGFRTILGSRITEVSLTACGRGAGARMRTVISTGYVIVKVVVWDELEDATKEMAKKLWLKKKPTETKFSPVEEFS